MPNWRSDDLARQITASLHRRDLIGAAFLLAQLQISDPARAEAISTAIQQSATAASLVTGVR